MPIPLLSTSPDLAWREWGDVRGYVNTTWDLENNPHHSMVGLTGSGKTFLGVNGILDLCKKDRVLIIDTKGDDPLLTSIGRPVAEIPDNPWYVGLGRQKDEPRAFWYRLVVKDSMKDHDGARLQVYNALKRVYTEGNWVVYVDEMYDLTAPRKPYLGLSPYVIQIYRKGRGRRVGMIAGTQTPSWVPTEFYTMASYVWLGRIRDREKQKRLMEIGGLDREHLPAIAQLKRRQWLLTGDNGEYFARTTVKV